MLNDRIRRGANFEVTIATVINKLTLGISLTLTFVHFPSLYKWLQNLQKQIDPFSWLNNLNEPWMRKLITEFIAPFKYY